jgi:hypothetical protein
MAASRSIDRIWIIASRGPGLPSSLHKAVHTEIVAWNGDAGPAASKDEQ